MSFKWLKLLSLSALIAGGVLLVFQTDIPRGRKYDARANLTSVQQFEKSNRDLKIHDKCNSILSTEYDVARVIIFILVILGLGLLVFTILTGKTRFASRALFAALSLIVLWGVFDPAEICFFGYFSLGLTLVIFGISGFLWCWIQKEVI